MICATGCAAAPRTVSLAETLRRTWLERDDRGAEERLAARDRQPLVPLSSLKKNPHLEMHTRGG